MELLLFETDPESILLWTQIATAHGMRTTVRSRLSEADAPAHDSPPTVTIIDRSAVDGDLTERVADSVARARHSQFVVTGRTLRASEVASMMHKGVIYALERPMDKAKMGLVVEYARNRAAALVSKLQEFRHLSEQFATLTRRELDVLEHVLAGTSNREAAKILGVSVRTVESRRAKLYRKLDSRSVAEVIRKIDHLEMLRLDFFPEHPRIVPAPSYLSRSNVKMHTVA